MGFKVCKFGGTSVGTSRNIQQIEKILGLDSARRCVVVSAPGKAPGVAVKVTDLLIKAVQKSLKNQDFSTEVAETKLRYQGIYETLGLKPSEVDRVLGDLDARMLSSRENPAKYRDFVVAAGEDLNAILFAEYLRSRGKQARYVSPKDAGLLVTADFGDAQPIENSLALASLKQACADAIVIFPGFFGITKSGDVATFSRGGSDLTGSIVAEAIDASEYENWTDVDGIFSTNPSIVTEPSQIPALTYREMRELSYVGFNVLHEEAVRPTMRKKIPIRLRNTNNLDNAGTLIVSQRLPSERDVVGIASGPGYCSFTLEKFLMNREKGFGRRLLSILEELHLSYEHCPSGVDNISVILDQSQLTPEAVNGIVRTIEERLQPDNIRTEFGIALVAVVGEGLLNKVGVLAQAAGCLAQAGVNIKMANQGSSEISMIFGIDASDEKKAVNALYEEFFRKPLRD